MSMTSMGLPSLYYSSCFFFMTYILVLNELFMSQSPKTQIFTGFLNIYSSYYSLVFLFYFVEYLYSSYSTYISKFEDLRY